MPFCCAIQVWSPDLSLVLRCCDVARMLQGNRWAVKSEQIRPSNQYTANESLKRQTDQEWCVLELQECPQVNYDNWIWIEIHELGTRSLIRGTDWTCGTEGGITLQPPPPKYWWPKQIEQDVNLEGCCSHGGQQSPSKPGGWGKHQAQNTLYLHCILCCNFTLCLLLLIWLLRKIPEKLNQSAVNENTLKWTTAWVRCRRVIWTCGMENFYLKYALWRNCYWKIEIWNLDHSLEQLDSG